MDSAPSALHRCTRCTRWHDRGAGRLCDLCARVVDAEREFGFDDDDPSHTESRWDHFREDYL